MFPRIWLKPSCRAIAPVKTSLLTVYYTKLVITIISIEEPLIPLKRKNALSVSIASRWRAIATILDRAAYRVWWNALKPKVPRWLFTSLRSRTAPLSLEVGSQWFGNEQNSSSAKQITYAIDCGSEAVNGIQSLASHPSTHNQHIYNLQGVEVGTDIHHLLAGVYVMGGGRKS